MCAHLDIPSPLAAGIHPQSPPHRVRRWVDLVVSPSLNLALRQRLQASIYSLSTTRLPHGATFSVNAGPDVFVYGEVVLRSMRGSGALPVGVMIPSLVDVPQNILVSLKVADSVMPLWGICSTPCLSAPSLDDLRAQWSSRCGISPQFAQAWSRHSWIFDPSSVLNSPGSIRAHIYFVGAVCQRFDSTSAV